MFSYLSDMYKITETCITVHASCDLMGADTITTGLS